MILSKRAALGGVQLDEVDEAIVIREIDPGTPAENLTSVDRMGGAGSRVTGDHFSVLECKVTFAINIWRDFPEERRRVYDAAVAWARRKGWLTMSQVPDRRAYVDKVLFESPGDMRDWTKEYTFTFRCHGVPFWQDETPAQSMAGSITSGSIQIEVPGTAPTVLEATFRNISGQKIANFAIGAAGNTITLTGVDLAANQVLTIDHDTGGLLRIRKGNTSVYSLYTGADDLYVEPGTVSVSVTASRAGELTVRAYGRYV